MLRFSLALSLAILSSCASVEVEPVGSGDFIITNYSTYQIRAVLHLVPQRGGGSDTTEIIPIDSSKKVLQNSEIGVNITPRTTLAMLEIRRVYPESLSTTYWQNPIDESKWQIQRNYTGNYGNTTNTFIFTGTN